MVLRILMKRRPTVRTLAWRGRGLFDWRSKLSTAALRVQFVGQSGSLNQTRVLLPARLLLRRPDEAVVIGAALAAAARGQVSPGGPGTGGSGGHSAGWLAGGELFSAAAKSGN